jgi:proton-dependent oligopeptide transporter, POT family
VSTETININAPDESNVLGHRSGLFVLFFTEMWERFSFYGMRVLLINFLTMALVGVNPGWEWTQENAAALFGTYAGLLYLTPIVGGIIADKITGYRWAVVIGAALMTLGHACMALETELSLYGGLALLVIGTGFFKPTMTSIISELYKKMPEKKDGAYTIYYMGVNAGAFFGMMLCGYLAEKIGWSWGFGLAGIFMLLGTVQFWLSKPLFGHIGDIPKNLPVVEEEEEIKYKENHFTLIDKILLPVTALIGVLYIFNDPLSKIADINILPKEFIVDGDIMSGPLVITCIGLVLFLYMVFSRIFRYERIVRDRMIAFVILAFFTVFFWMAFEQGATSLVLFARDFTDRTLDGTAATIFNIVNTLLTVGPLAIVSWVLYLLYKQTHKKIMTSNIVLILSFVIMWGIVGWMLNREYNSNSYEFTYQMLKKEQVDEKTGEKTYNYETITEATLLLSQDVIVDTTGSFITYKKIEGDVFVHEEQGSFKLLPEKGADKLRAKYIELDRKSKIIKGTELTLKSNEVEITTSWFSILNSFFIIAFASLFSKWWESKYNPSGAIKFGLGLIVMGAGYAILAFGTADIPQGAEAGSVRVGMVWLILAYLFHTLGELCSSPVGLSFVSKLVPARMIGLMFGMWYLAIAIGNKLAATMGGMSEEIANEYSMSTFFWIVTAFPVISGVIIIFLNPLIKKLMHGVK